MDLIDLGEERDGVSIDYPLANKTSSVCGTASRFHMSDDDTHTTIQTQDNISRESGALASTIYVIIINSWKICRGTIHRREFCYFFIL